MNVIGNRGGEDFPSLESCFFYSPRHKALSVGA